MAGKDNRTKDLRQFVNQNNYLDFEQIKKWLEQYNTEEELKAAEVELLAEFPKMTDKQHKVIDRLFAIRRDYIEYGDPYEAFGFKEVKKEEIK